MLKLVASFCAALAMGFGARAETFPDKPIDLVVPFAPGGTVNLMARLLSNRLSEVLGQPVVVDNKAGAGGNIGAAYVAKATPNGYTLLYATMGNQAIQPLLFKSLPYSPKDFTPIAMFATVPNVLVVSADTPARNIGELLQYAKANPGKLNYGSAGIGSVNHMTGELFMLKAGVNLTHIPYKGMGPATADLLAGQLQILFVNLPTVQSYIKAGKMRVLAIASDKRSPSLPDVPTLAEAGVKDATVESWSALMAPARTSPQIIKKLQDAVLAIAHEKPMIAQMAEQGAVPLPLNSADLAKRINEDTKRWDEVVKKAKITLD